MKKKTKQNQKAAFSESRKKEKTVRPLEPPVLECNNKIGITKQANLQNGYLFQTT
jgi:hypothetical protein